MVIKRTVILFSILSVFSSLFSSFNPAVHGSQIRTYIVHVDPPTNIELSIHEEYEKWCMSFLQSTLDSTGAVARIVHIYGDVIHGFAARLTDKELANMEKMEGFVSAYPDRILPLHTTHTPEFLGVRTHAHHYQVLGDGGNGVIVGVLDTGITPDHPSFNGDGMPPPPSKWKGKCHLPSGMCNNKLIGFMSFNDGAKIHYKEDLPIFDQIGHGTHTASTIAGAAVDNANILGEANGTAIGMAPRAHLAIYQVCSCMGCSSSDILAGMNAAIKDGVDVLSLSLGGGPGESYDSDNIAIGAFRAIQRGIFVSCSAGNGGPDYKSVTNEAPWILTVGASSIDRRIRSTVRLGDGQELEGQTLYQPKNFNSTLMRPLVLAGPNMVDVKDKIVLCGISRNFISICQGDDIRTKGGAGLIHVNILEQGYETFATNHSIPSSNVNYVDGNKIKHYVDTSDNPKATFIFKNTVFNISPSPSIAYFSSRGPSLANPGILKPDITGPGIDILAAYPPREDSRPEAKFSKYSFSVLSGTSMSAPHLSGIAALLKSVHPDWSPAAIKSAIMTTSNILDRDGNSITNEKYVPANLFAIGAGNVNPPKAINPGLVYDITPEDYISFLCQMNYTETQLKIITGHKVKCSQVKKIPIKNLNYPSISVEMPVKANNHKVVVTRTVTNVRTGKSSYFVKVDKAKDVSVMVNPQMLNFSQVNEKKSFIVSFVEKSRTKSSLFSKAYLSWVSKEDDVVVRIPMSIKFD